MLPAKLDDGRRQVGARSGSATRSSTCPRASPCTRASSRCSRSAAKWPTRARSTGRSPSCSPSARWSTRASWSACPARTRGAARSRSVTRSSSTARPAPSTPRCRTCGSENPGKFLGLRLRTQRVRRRRLRVRLLAWATRTRWCCGRRSSVTSSTARSRSSTSSSRPVRPSGVSCPTSCCCCRTATRVRVPDHTSGRIERFLQLCAEGSMTVAVPSTPASYFHLLRRHALDGIRRPLVVFTPKSMLRNKAAVSDVEDFTDRQVPLGVRGAHVRDGRRRPRQGASVSCSSAASCTASCWRRSRRTTATTSRSSASSSCTRCRSRRLNETLDRYPNATEFRWVQEEPANQGAWPFFGLALPELLPDKLSGIKRISRRAMSAPSSGSSKVHAVEQQEIIDEAFS